MAWRSVLLGNTTIDALDRWHMGVSSATRKPALRRRKRSFWQNRCALKCCSSSRTSLAGNSSRRKCWMVLGRCLAVARAASARPCGLQSFAPLRARALCPAPRPWLRDGATLSENAHLCRSCPMQCPLLFFSWEGREGWEACRRHKTVGRWAPLKIARVSQCFQGLEPSVRSQPARRSSAASLCVFLC